MDQPTAQCDICHKYTTEYRYHATGSRTIGTLIVCKPCDEKHESKGK